MSRSRKAMIASGFSYAQFASAILVGVALVPLMLDSLGSRTYGLWLATGEILAYLTLLDLGVFAVLPWMVASADGQGDRPQIRSLLAHGLLIGGLVSVLYVVVAATGWLVMPWIMTVTEADRAILLGPLAIVVAATALAYPLQTLSATLNGLQDFGFTGAVALGRVVLSALITAGLLLNGSGLYALAVGLTVPTLLALVLSGVRLVVAFPGLIEGISWPSWSGTAVVAREGVGGWLGAFGWKLSMASHAVVLAYLGHPVLIPVFACTAKLSQLLLQMAWVIPDSALVGLAQLGGEGRAGDVRAVVASMIRLHLVLAGGVACLLLLVNPSFVRWWVGPEFFGGLALSATLAVGVVVSSFAHALVTTVAALGHRIQVGLGATLHGLTHLVLAVLLGMRYSLMGLAAAGLLSALVTLVPLGLSLLGSTVGISPGWLVARVVAPWLWRFALVGGAAAALGVANAEAPPTRTALVAIVVGAIYLWAMRACYEGLPLSNGVRRWLSAVGLAPSGIGMPPEGRVGTHP